MTKLRADPDVSLPPAPATVPVLGAGEGHLASPGPATGSPFLAEAPGVSITGTERHGVARVLVDGAVVLTDLSTDAGPAANVVATPASLRRELIGPLGMVQESVLAVAHPATAAVQWQGRAAGAAAFHLRFRVPAAGRDVRYRVGEHALVAHVGEEAAPRVVVIHPPPLEWRVVEADDGGLDVEARVDAVGAVTLGAGAPRRPASVTRALEHLAVHAGRIHSVQDGADATRLETGLPELDDGVAWIAARIRNAPGDTGAHPLHVLWWGLGALAVGASEAAERSLDILERGGAHDHAALLAARFALTTGRQEHAGARLDFVPASVLGGIAAQALAEALRHAAPEEAIERLRAVATEAPGHGGPVRSLPMVGGPERPEAPSLPSWIRALITYTARVSGPQAILSETAAVITALAGDRLEGYGEWRRRLAEGVAGGSGGRGTWDAATDGCPGVAGALACALLHGMVGWQPDAPVGRVVLAPALPRHLTAFSVRGLVLGDARLSLDYRRREGEHLFTLTPDSARVPPNVVFEPTVVANAVAEVLLDGDRVELDVHGTRDGWTVRVQIPLDGPRTLRVKTGA